MTHWRRTFTRYDRGVVAGATPRWTPGRARSTRHTHMRLHHVALGARDVEVVARFYRLAFDLEERRRFTYDDGSLRSIWLEADTVLLMVEHSEAPPKRVEAIGAGPFLLAFHVPAHTRAELEARLGALGANVETATDFTAYARDPEGNRVAISHYPEPRS